LALVHLTFIERVDLRLFSVIIVKRDCHRALGKGMAKITVKPLKRISDTDINGLADVMMDCVAKGASVGFMNPLPRTRATAFWQRVADDVHAGKRILIVAQDHVGICGTAQIILDQPDNQPHRGDLAKMLVHTRARRQGLGAALLNTAEAEATKAGKSLLVLDTASDEAERLYERNGWVRVGAVPDFALLPDGGLCTTIFFYKRLASREA
jgi:GNAT superfamily N-acetyltransferase